MDPEILEQLSFWVDQYGAASEDLESNAAAAVAAGWLAFDDWYDAAQVRDLADLAVDLSAAGREAAVGMAFEYVDQVLAVLGIDSRAARREVQPPPVRNGADLRLVHSRPAEAFRRQIATGADEATAREAAVRRAEGLVITDLSLTERNAQQDRMASRGVERYRRVLRPELSKTGSCGLCIAASDRVYRTGELMPIHPPWCKCKTMAIVGDDDPGRSLNRLDLKRIYRDAGSKEAAALKRVRYEVNEHGELGPLLTKRGNRFRGPGDVPLEQDPARAAQMLTKVLPVLDQLEARAAAGEDVTGPLGYQRSLVARLRRIAA